MGAGFEIQTVFHFELLSIPFDYHSGRTVLVEGMHGRRPETERVMGRRGGLVCFGAKFAPRLPLRGVPYEGGVFFIAIGVSLWY